MPKFYFNVSVNQTGPEVEKDLKRFGKIRTKIEEIGLYTLVCKVGTKNVKEERDRLESELSKRPYMSRVRESSELELLNA